MSKSVRCLFLSCLFISLNAFGWNSVGHKVVAQIAINNLPKNKIKTLDNYNQELSKNKKTTSLVNSATWLDYIRDNGLPWYNELHYKDKYFSQDETPLPTVAEQNAPWAINEAIKVLNNPKNSKVNKALALRILLHVTGDIHQPLHNASRVTHEHPDGDYGGNLYMLKPNKVGNNLHLYWDNAGGLLKTKKTPKALAKSIGNKYPCQKNIQINPDKWSSDSNEIARTKAYSIKEGALPDSKYQKMVQEISEKQLAIAGCRLAAILQDIE